MSGFALRSTRVVAPEGVRAGVLEVRDGRIVALHAHDARPAAVPVEDLGDLVLMPGLVDSHVHVNEPGRTEWEGFASATRAAAAGGVTTIADMPLNSVPATTTVAALDAKRAAARGQAHVDVGFLGGAVPGGTDALRALATAGVLGFKCFMVPSGVDEFPAVSESDLDAALATLSPLGATLMAHAEWPTALLPTPPSTRRHAEWAASRPPEAEAEAIAMLARLAGRHGARVHVVHVSSAAGCRAVAAARAAGVAMSAETCPHYLALTGDDVPDGATEYKCAPPLRTAADREALWAALADGTLMQVVSDHSPCPPEDKARGTGDFIAAWGGIASLQSGLPVTWTAARDRGVSFADLARWMSAAPARLLGLADRKGALAPGLDADLVAWSPESSFTLDPATLLQRHPLTPYAGRRLYGVVEGVWLRGTRLLTRGSDVAGPHGILLEPGNRPE